MTPIKIVIVGDSHTMAVDAAVPGWSSAAVSSVKVYRIQQIRNGEPTWTPLDEIIEAVRQLGPSDIVCSVAGGNQHQVVGLIKHDQPFDFFEPGRNSEIMPDTELIPHAVIYDHFYTGISKGRDGAHLRAIRDAAKCKVFHAAPPPPKADEAHILRKHETHFKVHGIAEKGISPAPLRLKLWRLQVRVLGQVCREIGIELLAPPDGTQDAEGFLLPEYFANDATHGNAEYGRKLLDQLAALGGDQGVGMP